MIQENGEIVINLTLALVESLKLGMTINDLAKTVQDGFDAINQRLDKVEAKLEEHSDIFARNNLK